jgi:hypothetical protein
MKPPATPAVAHLGRRFVIGMATGGGGTEGPDI